MPKAQIKDSVIKRIVNLRKTGHSLPEIQKIVGRGGSTVFKYIQGVSVLPEYKQILKSKQGGSIAKSNRDWLEAHQNSKNLLDSITTKDRLVVLACLYWGEGDKRDLSLNNSDPALIKVFVECLKCIGVKKEDLRITLRLYEDINENQARVYWAKIVGISEKKILGINFLPGKKRGKLKYGMCRVRVTKGGPYFKLIMSMIDLIKSDFNAAVVQRIEQDTPNV